MMGQPKTHQAPPTSWHKMAELETENYVLVKTEKYVGREGGTLPYVTF